MNIRLSLAALFLTAGFAQQIGQNNTNGTAATFSASTQLVIETVVVKDKSGKSVEGLTAKDFTILEDGTPQTIKFFEYQKLPEEPVAAAAVAPEKVVPLKKYPNAQIAPETVGKTMYKDKRLMVMYFDLTGMQAPDQIRAFSAAEKFVRTQMTSADLMALMMYSGSAVRVLQDFTDDRERLLSLIETMVVGEDEDADTTNDASTADNGAAFGQDDSEFNIFNTDRQLSALQTASKMLSMLNEKKSLIYFASGIRLNGLDNQAQLHATVNAAIRSGVSFWPIDARGLVADGPLGNATRGSPGGAGMYTGTSSMALTNNFQQSQDTLWALAADTGGKALLDYNDLSKGIVQAQQAVSNYYILGYYTTNTTLDGKFRRIKITLNNDVSAKMDFRQGYFSNKQFGKFTTAEKERQLEDALMLGDPITELTIALELDYFQLNRAEYFVPLIVKIPGSELALARRGGADHTLIDFIGEVKDDFGTTVSNVRDKIDVKLSDSTAAELAKRPVGYDTGFTLLPGKYTLKFLARDAETGRIGTYQIGFVIPNLNKEDKRVPISSVVLSSQRQDRRESLYTVNKDKGAAAAVNPLILDGQQLIPSVTRVFNKSRDMYIYLQAYEREATSTRPLVAFVTFYRGQTKAFETPPLPVTEGLDPKSKAVPLRFSVALNKLPPGEYRCQVTVLDPGTQKAAFWQAEVMLVQ